MDTKIISAAILTLLFILPACENNEGPAEKLGESIDQSYEDAKDAVADTSDDISDSLEEAGDEVEDTADEISDSMETEDAELEVTIENQ